MKVNPFSVAAVVDLLRDTYPTSEVNYFHFENCIIVVRSNNRRISKMLNQYFKDFILPVTGTADISISVHEARDLILENGNGPLTYTVKPPDPGKTKIKDEYINFDGARIVRKRLTDMTFLFNGNRHAAVGPCLQNMNQVVNFINNRFIQWKLCRGCLLGHAAGIIWENQGLALAGFSGTGKSTIALHLMSKGATFVSNDRLMIENAADRLKMFGVPKLPRINPGTILNNPNLIKLLKEEEFVQFTTLSKEELWELEYKFDVPIDECFGPKRFTLCATMKVLAILNWNMKQGPMQVREVSLNERKDLLPAFMKEPGLFFLPPPYCRMPEADEANYTKSLSTCRVLEFTGSPDFEKAAEVCISVLGTRHK